jgi:hypothetical protein
MPARASAQASVLSVMWVHVAADPGRGVNPRGGRNGLSAGGIDVSQGAPGRTAPRLDLEEVEVDGATTRQCQRTGGPPQAGCGPSGSSPVGRRSRPSGLRSPAPVRPRTRSRPNATRGGEEAPAVEDGVVEVGNQEQLRGVSTRVGEHDRSAPVARAREVGQLAPRRRPAGIERATLHLTCARYQLSVGRGPAASTCPVCAQKVSGRSPRAAGGPAR